MIAVDTNLLVYAHRRDCEFHEEARAHIATLAQSRDAWCIPLHCLVEFAAVATNRVWSNPSTASDVANQVTIWRESPTLRILTEDQSWWSVFAEVLDAGRASGGAVHDARIASTCRYHGVSELHTADRDFGRYPWLKTVNPLVG